MNQTFWFSSFDVLKHDISEKMLRGGGTLRGTEVRQILLSLENEVIWPMGSLLRDASATIREAYRRALQLIAGGTQYFDNSDFTEITGDLKLWQHPRAEMITPIVLAYKFQEADTWRVYYIDIDKH